MGHIPAPLVQAEVTVFSAAAFTTVAAATLPWLRRGEEHHLVRERVVLLSVLGVDALFEWIAMVLLARPQAGAAWLFTFLILAMVSLGTGAYVAVRGHELPPIVRWPSAAVLALVEPLLLFLCFMAVALAVSFV